VRETYEREAGYIEGTTHIELERLAAQAGTLDRDKPVIFYCRSDNRSDMAAAVLAEAGYDTAKLAEGATGWEEEGLELVPKDGYVAESGAKPEDDNEDEGFQHNAINNAKTTNFQITTSLRIHTFLNSSPTRQTLRSNEMQVTKSPHLLHHLLYRQDPSLHQAACQKLRGMRWQNKGSQWEGSRRRRLQIMESSCQDIMI